VKFHELNRRFGVTERSNFLCQNVGEARNQQSELAACFMLVSCFDPEDGGDMFLRKVGCIHGTSQRYIPEDRTLHNHHCENLKS
jgi:hypothetical protein